jgi:alkylation response protein AidB-like acyl-CoA dehydrogenase
MSTDLNELHESARQVLSEVGLAAAEDKAWPIVVDLGWLLVAVPEALGGLELGFPSTCAIYTELGRSLASAPYLPATLAIAAVCASERSDREGWVQKLTSSDYVTVPLADCSLTVAEGPSGKARAKGLATAVPSADKASHVLVCASDGDCVALAPIEQPGVELIARPTWDATRRLFDVRFAELEIDEKLVLAHGPAAQALTRKISTERDFGLAADSVGGASALLEMTVEYLQTRRQFGRPLALFQALKHRCADLKAQTAAAEALLLDNLNRTADRIGTPEAAVMGKAAKYLACSVYSRVAEEALQLHGGIGMTSEHPCHLFLKRAMLNEQLGENPDRYELDIAASVLSRSA